MRAGELGGLGVVTIVVGQVEQHPDHGPHAVLHRLAHVAETAVGQQRPRRQHGAVVERPAVALDHVLAVPQGPEEHRADRGKN